MGTFNNDILEPNLAFAIEEGSSEVDGEHVLAKIKGEFFVPEGFSRNKRFYPRELWESVLKSKDVQTELKNRTMFGAISHSTPMNDESFRDGKFSHIITKMYIDENGKGIGEALVLNTPTGRILNTVARAGSKLFVSTRADGSFKGKTNEGIPIVNKDTYKYHTTDFVLRPGFLQANPELAEAFNNIDKTDIQENEKMDKVVKALTEENGSLKVDLSELGKTYEALKTENADTLEENATLKEENDRLTKVEKEVTDLKEQLKSYHEIDTAENIVKALDVTESALNTLEEKSKSYEGFGTVEEVELAIASGEELIEKVNLLGGMDAIDKTITIAEKLISEKEELKLKESVAKLADELNVSEEKINRVYGKLTEEEIKELFSDIQPIKENDDGDDSGEFKKYVHEDEDFDIKPRDNGKSRCASLMESFSNGL